MFMKYLYGTFSDKQIEINTQLMHNEVHKLLLYKDNNITDIIFEDDDAFLNYFKNLLYRFGGLNTLLGEPVEMVGLMSTLQAAYNEIIDENYSWKSFRRLILDSHGYISSINKEG